MQARRIALIAGDGIGPEVTHAAKQLLEWQRSTNALPIELWELDLGADRYLRDGTTFPDEIRRAIGEQCAAVFVGALGDARVPGFEHARDILFGMRFGFDLFANVRPIKALSDRVVPLKGRNASDIDMVIFRENTEGIYAGIGGQLRRGTADEIAINEDVNTRRGVERIIRAAFQQAAERPRKLLHMADKSNAMRAAHELWLRTFREVAAEYPAVTAKHIYVDTLCLELVQAPEQFDVIVTNNLFGDIVSDLGAALMGGLGMAPSANLNLLNPGSVALFEPVHGSAPDLVGQHCANPFAALLTVGMLLAHLGWPDIAATVEAAVARALELGECTPDVGGQLSTEAATAAVIRELSALLG
jgi:3-isopropylmalate dehydrogenase